LFIELHWIVVIDAFRVTIIIICELLSWGQNPCISLYTLHGLAPLPTEAATNTIPAARLQAFWLEPLELARSVVG
jgi:hypothetical protein